jgi:hypothetical protein
LIQIQNVELFRVWSHWIEMAALLGSDSALALAAAVPWVVRVLGEDRTSWSAADESTASQRRFRVFGLLGEVLASQWIKDEAVDLDAFRREQIVLEGLREAGTPCATVMPFEALPVQVSGIKRVQIRRSTR